MTTRQAAQALERAAHYAAVYQATVLDNPWVWGGFLRLPQMPGVPPGPSIKQAEFLVTDALEVLYGGAARGGKSVALLAAALQYIQEPGYSALLLRRRYTDLSLSGALMDLAHTWLGGTSAQWKGQEKSWSVPGGGRLQFGYLESLVDMYRYQSSAFHFIGFDELTQYLEPQYRYLFSRLTRPKGDRIPLRMRAATNPGGVGADWVRKRFITERVEGRQFIPARLPDNPHTDQEEYKRSLSQLDPVTRQQLLNGDWDIRAQGEMFKRQWFEVVAQAPPALRQCRWWDLAATPGGGDYTVGLRLLLDAGGTFYVQDVQRTQLAAHGVRQLMAQVAMLDTPACPIRMGQEPGAAGKILADDLARSVLLGFDFKAVPETGSKVVRAGPASAAAEAGRLKLVAGPWVPAFLDELEAFPNGAHDDQVDALSGAMGVLAGLQRLRAL